MRYIINALTILKDILYNDGYKAEHDNLHSRRGDKL